MPCQPLPSVLRLGIADSCCLALPDMNTSEVTCSPVTLHRLRIARGYSIGELAALAGRTAGCVSRIESGQRNARPATTRALAAALGVAPYELHPESARTTAA